MKKIEDRPHWQQMLFLFLLCEVVLCAYVFTKLWAEGKL